MSKTLVLALLFCSLLVSCGSPDAPGDGVSKSGTSERVTSGASLQNESTREERVTTIDERTGRPGEEPARRAAEVRRRLEAVSAGSGVRVGVCVEWLDGDLEGRRVSVGGEEVFQSASIIKLPILMELLRQVDSGEASLSEPLGQSTVGDLARDMISASDNDATNLLIDRVGEANVNALARRLGLDRTRLERKMLDFDALGRGEDNYTSACDTVRLLDEVWRGETLSPESRDFALAALGAQERNGKIPPSLPAGSRIFHKTGELPQIEHDAGIVAPPVGASTDGATDGVFAIAVLTEGDSSLGIAAIQEATRAVVERTSS